MVEQTYPRDKVLMTRTEFCRWSGIPLSTLKDWEKSGLVTPVMLHRPYYTKAHLRKLIKDGLHRETPYTVDESIQDESHETEPDAAGENHGQQEDGGVSLAI